MRMTEIDEVLPDEQQIQTGQKRKMNNVQLPVLNSSTSEEDLSRCTLSTLRTALEDLKLKKSGKKAELIQRILEHLRQEPRQGESNDDRIQSSEVGFI